VAASGAEALTVIRSTPDIDLIITDYAMPGMTGMVLADRIREIRPELRSSWRPGLPSPPAPAKAPASPRLRSPIAWKSWPPCSPACSASDRHRSSAGSGG